VTATTTLTARSAAVMDLADAEQISDALALEVMRMAEGNIERARRILARPSPEQARQMRGAIRRRASQASHPWA
jgi:hypothetical protein